MIENTLYILKSILSLSLNAQGRANQSTNVMYKRGQDLVPARLEGKKLPKVDYFSPILQNCKNHARAQHVKAQFARQDVTAKTDSAGECFDPLLELVLSIWIYFLQSTTYIRKNHL